MAGRFGACSILLAVLALGCDPDPVEVELLAYDQPLDSYTFQTVTLSTIDDVERLEGRATTMIGGAAFTFDLRSGYLKWDDAGDSVAFDAIDVDGVLIPADFDSLAMVSIYYGLELSLEFFEKVGMPRGQLEQLDTYYWPDFETIYQDGESEVIADNAYYMYLNDKRRAFFVFPYDQFQWIPMSINSGIMTHEFSHAVFDSVVDDPNRGLFAGMDSAAVNFLYSLNEGIADYTAAARTGDPDFMSHTTPKGIFAIQCNSEVGWSELVRDVSMIYNYHLGMDGSAREVATDEFCPYDIGLFFASTMYGIARAIEGSAHNDFYAVPSRESQERVARWLYGAMTDLGQSLEIDFELWDMFGLLVGRIESEEDRATVCDVLLSRYFMHFSEVEGC
jgi:hypothetical protein